MIRVRLGQGIGTGEDSYNVFQLIVSFCRGLYHNPQLFRVSGSVEVRTGMRIPALHTASGTGSARITVARPDAVVRVLKYKLPDYARRC